MPKNKIARRDYIYFFIFVQLNPMINNIYSFITRAISGSKASPCNKDTLKRKIIPLLLENLLCNLFNGQL